MEEKKVNKNAIYSIICSAISIIIFWWLSIAGLGFGVKALKEIKTTNEKGKALAIVGIVIGVIGIIMYLYAMVV